MVDSDPQSPARKKVRRSLDHDLTLGKNRAPKSLDLLPEDLLQLILGNFLNVGTFFFYPEQERFAALRLFYF